MLPRPSTACKQLVSGSISLPSPGCFSPFPHGTMRYRSLRVCSLGEWSPQLHAGFLVSGATQAPSQAAQSCSYRALTVYGAAFQAASDRSCNKPVADDRPPWMGFQPPCRNAGQLDTAQV
jgi:hypothetical protein